jgi:hypothetical protein
LLQTLHFFPLQFSDEKFNFNDVRDYINTLLSAEGPQQQQQQLQFPNIKWVHLSDYYCLYVMSFLCPNITRIGQSCNRNHDDDSYNHATSYYRLPRQFYVSTVTKHIKSLSYTKEDSDIIFDTILANCSNLQEYYLNHERVTYISNNSSSKDDYTWDIDILFKKSTSNLTQIILLDVTNKLTYLYLYLLFSTASFCCNNLQRLSILGKCFNTSIEGFFQPLVDTCHQLLQQLEIANITLLSCSASNTSLLSLIGKFKTLKHLYLLFYDANSTVSSQDQSQPLQSFSVKE